MVLAEIRDIARTNAVLLDAHAEVRESPRRIGRAAPGARPAEVAPGAVKNRLPKLLLVLCSICPLLMVPSGA